MPSDLGNPYIHSATALCDSAYRIPLLPEMQKRTIAECGSAREENDNESH